MSSLYRCKARVGYRPANYDKIILFEERQIQDVDVKLVWKPGFTDVNVQGGPIANLVNSLQASTATVTLTDPYFAGASWVTLFDLASFYTNAGTAAANNIVLPPCKDGQDPIADKCFRFTDLVGESKDTAGITKNRFPHLWISLWYEVNGTSFGTDFYFRVQGVNISHGSSFPRVQISGIEANSVVFNQSIKNYGFKEGLELNKAIQQIAEDSGFAVSFCAPQNANADIDRIIPDKITEEMRLKRSIRMKGVTPDEAIKRILNSTNGNMLSQPVKDFANKISVCTRGDVNQGCTVFYLGKGLYQGYEIKATPELTFAQLNADRGSSEANDESFYTSESFEEEEYEIGDLLKQTREKALSKVKKVEFKDLFSSTDPRPGGPDNTGYMWKGAGPVVKNEKVEKTILFGTAPNGTKAASIIGGTVIEASTRTGRVLVKSEFVLSICKKKDTKKCFYRPIYQESRNLTTVTVKPYQKLEIGEEIGSSTEEKKEFTRFYIQGHGMKLVTLDPQIVYKYSVPTEELAKSLRKPEENKAPTDQNTQATQQAQAQLAPGGLIGRLGNTGRSTGPHLHAEWTDKRAITPEQVKKYIRFGQEPVFTSGYRSSNRPNHNGVDLAAPEGTPMYLQGGAGGKKAEDTKCSNGDSECGGGYGNSVIISTPEGDMRLAHLVKDSIPPNLPGITAASSAGNNSSAMKPGPSAQGLIVETSFKGVPRALRIIPGRTVLSFVTNYDDWLDAGRPKDGPDPGVWVAKRFSNWFITQASYQWTQGDLKVSLEGVSPWGTRMIQVPSFDTYVQTMKEAGEMSSDKGSDYYNYIRSLGTLDWKMDSGKNSSSEICSEAQELTKDLFNRSQGSSGSNAQPGSTSSSYPVSKCRYKGTAAPADRVQAIINAAEAGGIKTKAGLAAVVGNAMQESTRNLSPTAENSLGAYGVFQWLDRRPALEAFAKRLGKPASDFGVQMQYFVAELKGADFKGKSTVAQLNQTSDIAQATRIFDTEFERSGGSAMGNRIANAQQIFQGLNCE